MKAYPYNRQALQETHAAALAKNFAGDADKMLQFMCRNAWDKAQLDGGQSYLAFGPYWWAVKRIIETTIGSQWGHTTADNPIMRKVFMVRAPEHAEAFTLLLADEYRYQRLGEFGLSPHHQLDGEPDNDDEYTLEDGDMVRMALS